ncbi:T9SS type A sorting domain-containing protein [Mucilaginibacter gotjawali]|uniref:Secretion system C-terminal sorting domain-containing protein n=1 Tax=Mucilaginibacter gotjawali TaxID=1550579 RepID=A0A839SBI5_9SPHI|nr:T9SS type A sorting domain-containing protein [Mucilaginibacter gotjawali]MBB3054948.1 hypothetical protein [Mucilaginibacter gotjawali]
MKKTFFLFHFIIVSIFCIKSAEAAITYTWKGGSSGTWNLASNWTPSSGSLYPGTATSDIAIFPSGGTFTVTLNAAISLANINETSGTTLLTINTGGKAITVSSGIALGTNSSSLTFLGSGAVSIAGMTFQNGDFLNCGSATDATTQVTFTGANITLAANSGNGIFNYGTFNLTSSLLYTGSSSQINNESGGIFSCTSSSIYLQGGSSSIINSGTFNMLSSSVYLNVNPCAITNNPTGSFNMNGGSLISYTASNNEEIYNYGTFNATTGANSITMISGASDNTIYNYGTFNAGSGTSSVCTITLAATRGDIKNTSATLSGTTYNGIFNLGSGSVIKFDSSCSNCQVNNDASCASCTFNLISDANSSATIYQIPSGSTCPGTFNVQRYLQGGSTFTSGRWVYRNYRLMSSPVNTVSSNSSSTATYPVSLKYLANSAIVTGAKGGYAYPSTFNSATASGNPSIYFYREDITPSNTTFTSGNFIGVTDITDQTNYTVGLSDGSTPKISIGNGFFFFFRGNRTASIGTSPGKTTYPYVAPEPTVFTASGYLNQGAYQVQNWVSGGGSLKYEVNPTYNGVSQNNSAVRGFNLVGNPYPSSIDWETYNASNTSTTGIVVNTTSGVANVSPTIWVFNPFTNQYNTYMKGDGGIGKGSSGTGNGSTNANIIASGQAFFVQAVNHASTLTFYETAKSISQPASGYLLMGSPPPSTTPQYMRLILQKDSINNDDMLVFFNSAASEKYSPYEDAAYFPGLTAPESLASISGDSVKLAINRLPLPDQKAPRIIPLSVSAAESGQYTFLRTDLKAIPQLYNIWLTDKYTADSLDLRNNTTYKFNIDLSDTGTFGNHRFQLVIRQNPALMVHLLNFAGAKTSNGAQITWITENEENYTNFTVERSSDGGTTFSVLGGVASGAQGTYSFLDKNPPAAAVMYRLKITDLNGTVTYSNIVTLMYAGTNNTLASNISVYPNPASNVINLAISEPATGSLPGVSSLPNTLNQGASGSSNTSYSIKIVNITGLVIKSVTTTQTVCQANIGSLLPGTYIIQVLNNKDNSIVGKTTFIKQ